MQHGIKRRQWTKDLLDQKREDDEKKIASYKSLVKSMFQCRDNDDYTYEAIELTTNLLDMNPEFNTAWNYRRDIISSIKTQLDLGFWKNELKFTMIQLKKFPKVYWIWNHRVWTLDNFPSQQLTIWQGELTVVDALLELDSRNFHGWHYRRMVISKIEELSHSSLNKKEFDYVTSKINKNISNYSAWHQRVQLITDMLSKDQITDKVDFIKKEIDYITNAIFTDAEDQSVWFYIVWMVKFPTIRALLSKEDYSNFLRELKDNALMINADEVDFSGKENVWCLKIVLEIEIIQRLLCEPIVEAVSKDYLEKLIKLDPLRQNRYRFLLSKLP
ncbi:geranylgeranyl transferase type-2 subunit alpha [Monosporozyma unispora]|nr:Rab geranylgeranyltransferase [Kazachstania unispora]